VKADDIELSAPRSSFNVDTIEVINGKVIIHSTSLAQKIKDNIGNN